MSRSNQYLGRGGIHVERSHGGWEYAVCVWQQSVWVMNGIRNDEVNGRGQVKDPWLKGDEIEL